ncbi:hypothetical protein SprV_0401472400 [Sparganum proliferum]
MQVHRISKYQKPAGNNIYQPARVELKTSSSDVIMMSYRVYFFLLVSFTVIFSVLLLWSGKHPLTLYHNYFSSSSSAAGITGGNPADLSNQP